MSFSSGRIAIAALVIAGFAGGEALAQGRGAVGQACREDIAKFCAGVQPGGGRLKPCIQENYAKFSPACQGALREVLAARRTSAPAAPAAQPPAQ